MGGRGVFTGSVDENYNKHVAGQLVIDECCIGVGDLEDKKY